MFTGIIETLGLAKSARFSPGRRSMLLEVQARLVAKRFKIGGSLAVNGVCLTAVKRRGNSLYFNVIRETLRRSTLGFVKKGDCLNLERPLRLSGRLEGHIVLGHIDAVGTVRRIITKGNEKDFLISCPDVLRAFIFEKGSVAVDGVSLTIGKVNTHGFWIHCIPYTLRWTRFGRMKRGAKVNLEADMLTKLAAKQFQAKHYLRRISKYPKLIDKLRKAI